MKCVVCAGSGRVIVGPGNGTATGPKYETCAHCSGTGNEPKKD